MYAPTPTPQTGNTELERWLDYELNQVRSAIDGAADDLAQYKLNAATYFPWKAVACVLEGTGTGTAANLRSDAFNLVGTTAAWQQTGTYRLEIQQDTISGVDIGTLSYPVLSVDLPNSALGYGLVRVLPGAPTGFADLEVSEFYLQGQNLRIRTYDLQPGGARPDVVYVMALLNVVASGADPLPE